MSVPVYEYYCRTCNTKFEKLQPMSASSDAVDCPEGHQGAKRTLSLIARTSGSGAAESFDWAPSAGGCGCGGACSCGAFGAN